MLTWRCTPEATCARRSGACAHACCSCRAIRIAISRWARPSAKQPCSAIGACFVPSSQPPAIAREIRTDRSSVQKPRGSGGTCTSCSPSRDTPHSTALAVAAWRTCACGAWRARDRRGAHSTFIYHCPHGTCIYGMVAPSWWRREAVSERNSSLVAIALGPS